MKMNWSALLNADSQGRRSGGAGNGRNAFARDHSRVVFSEPFRRLQAKTQVFPVPDDDLIHTRLTHSLEVASVGQTLGQRIGAWLCAQGEIQASQVEDISWIVATACLAHDIGNPPFGHAGEDAIGQFFKQAEKNGAGWLESLNPQQQADLKHFEGNAQGYRLLTRLDMYRDNGGMRLTQAALAAFTKYPQGSDCRGSKRLGGKKFGFFADDAESFVQVADACGLIPVEGGWCRHPLASVMEAADDLCYHLLDLEDGLRLQLIDDHVARDILARLLGESVEVVSQWSIGALRGRAVGVLIDQVVQAFQDSYQQLITGTATEALTDMIPAAPVLKELYQLNMVNCYRCDDVLGLEQMGYTVIGGLLQALCDSAFGERNAHLIGLLGSECPGTDRPYQRLLAITDYVSGMSDRQALQTYRRWAGIAL